MRSYHEYRVCNLAAKSCKPCEGGTPPTTNKEIANLLTKLDQWENLGGEIIKTFQFKSYYQTIAFINAITWVSHLENHHPDLEVSYSSRKVHYSTHAIGGLSENDFICAAKVD